MLAGLPLPAACQNEGNHRGRGLKSILILYSETPIDHGLKNMAALRRGIEYVKEKLSQ